MRNLVASAAILVTAAGCAQPPLFPAGRPITVALYLEDPSLVAPITEGLRRDPRVVIFDVPPLDASEAWDGGRAFPVPQSLCDRAEAAGVHYVIEARRSSASFTRTRCVIPSTDSDRHQGAGPEPGDCDAVEIAGHASSATLRVVVMRSSTCNYARGAGARYRTEVEGPAEQSLPAAEAKRDAAIADTVADLFPNS